MRGAGWQEPTKTSLILNMDMMPPTTPILSQALGEVQLPQVNFYLLIPSSSGFSSSPLTLYYNAFYSPHRGGESLSLHMSKPSHSIFAHFSKNRGYSQFVSKLLVPNSIHQCVPTHPPQHTQFCNFHPMSKNFLTGQHSVSYSRAGLIAVRQNFPFNLVGNFLSHSTAVAARHLI